MPVMHKHTKNVLGQTFGQLTAIEFLGTECIGLNKTTAVWKFRCTCGLEIVRNMKTITGTLDRNCEPACRHGCKNRSHRQNNKLKQFLKTNASVEKTSLI